MTTKPYRYTRYILTKDDYDEKTYNCYFVVYCQLYNIRSIYKPKHI